MQNVLKMINLQKKITFSVFPCIKIDENFFSQSYRFSHAWLAVNASETENRAFVTFPGRETTVWCAITVQRLEMVALPCGCEAWKVF